MNICESCFGIQVSGRMTLEDENGFHTGTMWECKICGETYFVVELTSWKSDNKFMIVPLDEPMIVVYENFPFMGED